MGNAAGIRHYFMEAFTPYGNITLLPELLKEIKYTYLLTGGPGTGKSTMIKLIGIQLIDRGYNVDYIRSIREPDSVAGLVLPKQKICLLDENEFIPQTICKENYYQKIDFNLFCRQSRLEEYQERIEGLETSLRKTEERIIRELKNEYSTEEDKPTDQKDAKITNVQMFLALEKFFSSDQVGEDYPDLSEITEILMKIKKNLLSFYFLHALQLDGWLNLAPRFLQDFDRICVEGEDSAQILRDILQEVRCLGQVIEIIVHPLKPHTALGIIFPAKNLAVWKGNPSKIEEQGFKRKHSTELSRILEEYKIARVGLKNLINETVFFRKLDNLRGEILSSILTDLR